MQGLTGGAFFCYLFSCGNLGGLPWPSIMFIDITQPCPHHPLFCSRSLTTASALSSAKSAAAASSSEAAAAALRLRVYELDYDDEDNNNHSRHSISSESNGDDSVVVVNKPLVRPEGKTPFPCIPGDVLRIMQDRLNANASRTNFD